MTTGDDGVNVDTTFTFDCWVRCDTTAQMFIAGRMTNNLGSNRGWSLLSTGEDFQFQIHNSSGTRTDLSAGITLSTATWYHVQCSYDNTTMRLFVDGTMSTNAVSNGLDNDGASFYIGVDAYGTLQWYFDGYIDEARYSDNVRNTSNFTAPTAAYTNDANTVFLYHFDGDNGDTGTIDDDGVGGYGIHYQPISQTPLTETFDGLAFNNFGKAESPESPLHINPIDTDATVTINVQNASTPVADEDSTYTGTLTIQQTVTVKVTAKDTAGSAVQNARIYLEADSGGDLSAGTVILNALSNASGIVQDTGFNYTNPQPVIGKIRKGSTSPLYKEAPITGTITGNGLDLTITMVSDE
jgi:hypothetical protein